MRKSPVIGPFALSAVSRLRGRGRKTMEKRKGEKGRWITSFCGGSGEEGKKRPGVRGLSPYSILVI